ncbi:MAG: response regulator [Deltaproteobacteria bacterium]|nr:response regulator [Deltaproteobacteria bacterium]
MAHVLIVDDQPYVREFLSEELAHDGYRTETIGDPDLIWGNLTHWRPDVVLLDLYLDGFKGWDILRDIKKKAPDLPVLILTAYDTFEEDPRLSQADGYVIKSFVDLDKLKEKIADVLERRGGNPGAGSTKIMERTGFPLS